MADSRITVRFWGVRGSVPAPITANKIEQKLLEALAISQQHALPPPGDQDALKEWLLTHVPFTTRGTYGGNTTCVEIRCGEELLIFDMGTGIRELGLSLMPETFKNRGLHGTIFQSHVHWDHIQGYPFWPQLYMPREQFKNHFNFYGGRDWDKSLEDALRGQMNPPLFPVDHRELEKTALGMKFNTVFDGQRFIIGSGANEIVVHCRKLNHPQETYGYRVEYQGLKVAFCTDHEPFASLHRPLVDLVRGVDLFITDCQYTLHEYSGAGGGVQKLGWGHSYPEYIAQVAAEAGVKKVVTTHHDPGSNDARIEEIAAAVETLAGIATVPAYEGLALKLE